MHTWLTPLMLLPVLASLGCGSSPLAWSAGGGDDSGMATGGDSGVPYDASPAADSGSPGNGDGGASSNDASGSGGGHDSGSGGTDAAGEGDAGCAVAAKQRVLQFLASLSGKKTVAGQHDKNNASPSDATDQVTQITGKAPGLWSGDFLFGGDVGDRPTMIAEAQKQWASGAIVQLMYHACAPTGDESCGWDDIGGGNPVHLSDAQWSDLTTPGGMLYQAWLGRLDALSTFFAQLQAACVAPLFRPQHEMNQGVFWWGGRPGPTGTRLLFQITHDYLVQQKGFDNIVWVWDVQDFSTLGTDVSDYDPGDAYYDIAALDVYDGAYDMTKYTTMQMAANGKPIAIGECSTLPTTDELTQQPDWTFFMLWPDFISMNQDAFPTLYTSSNVVTLDQMPSW
jgi:hypothetical protein